MTGTQEQFHRVEALFREALRLRAEQRERFLDEECPDADIRAEVVALLNEDDLTRGIVDEPVMGKGLDTMLAPTAVRTMPEQIGPYRLLHLLGEGGFGAVYLAEQRTPVRRRVAIKILKLGMDTAQVIARFEAERQALAMMDHAGIAKVFDAGATETGRLYFAMEYVQGAPLTQYCDDHGLDTRQRVELFRQVCMAIHHAHQKGVIHRDLKPSNVLVVEQDGRALPKVIDFGIAKATGAQLTDRTLVTVQRQFIGTPEYMSPEQAGTGNADVDTRTDIYSLGVLLYELLTGTTPFDTKQFRSAALDELARLIRDIDPEKPSTRLSSLTLVDTKENGRPNLAEVARRRRTDASHLRRELRGDLDWIVMRALEKDRNRRYESASALAEDLSRHLEHEPVAAGPPSLAYRSAKFIRRNRVAVAAGGLVTLAVLAGSTLAVIGMINASRQRDLAQAETQRAAAINDFLVEDLLAQAAPENNAVGEAMTVHQLLEGAAARIDDGRFEGQPRAKAGVLSVIADTYYALGDYENAVTFWRNALAVSTEVDGPHHEHTVTALDGLAQSLQAHGLLDESAAVNARSIEAARIAYEPDDPRIYTLVNNYAELLVARGDLSSAQPMHEKNLQNRRAQLGDDHPDTLDSLNNLAAVYYLRDDVPRAEEMFRECWRRRQRVLGEDHPYTLISMSNLGVTLKSQNKLAETEEIYRAVLEADARVQGPEHPNTLTDMNNLATLLFAQGKLDEALQMHRRTAELRRKVLGDDHPVVAISLVGLGDTLCRLDRPREAEPQLREALELRQANYAPDHHLVVSAVQSMGNCLHLLNRDDEAEQLYLNAWKTLNNEDGDLRAKQSIASALAEFYESVMRTEDAAAWHATCDALEEGSP